MILESIKIVNIRSIKNLELTFPQTRMLFYGDIGSKVLKAIEFALFGTLTSADLSGDSILRRGENKASVELSFWLDENRYVIKRGLSKNKNGNVSQTKGSLIVNGNETSYAATDLRRKILEKFKSFFTNIKNGIIEHRIYQIGARYEAKDFEKKSKKNNPRGIKD